MHLQIVEAKHNFSYLLNVSNIGFVFFFLEYNKNVDARNQREKERKYEHIYEFGFAICRAIVSSIDRFYLPAIPGECASNENPPKEKLRKSFSRSRCRSSCSNRSSLPPFDVEPGLCCSDKLLGTGECVPNDISESESSDGVGDELSA